jgi:NitT/TauT family transport system substrate-binding protein
MIDATAGGRVDAAFVVEPFLSAGVGGGSVQLVGWPYNTVQKNIPVAQYVATKSYIAANPAIIERFNRAYNKGVDWINQNKGSDEWAKILSGYTRLKPEQLKGLAIPAFQKTVDAKRIDEVIALMKKNGMIEGAFDTKGLLYKTAMAK